MKGPYPDHQISSAKLGKAMGAYLVLHGWPEVRDMPSHSLVDKVFNMTEDEVDALITTAALMLATGADKP